MYLWEGILREPANVCFNVFSNTCVPDWKNYNSPGVYYIYMYIYQMLEQCSHLEDVQFADGGEKLEDFYL